MHKRSRWTRAIGALPEKGVRRRQIEDKALIVVEAEEAGRGIGRIRPRHIPDAPAESLIPFVADSVEPGSVVHADGWLGYLPLEVNGYRHRITYLKDHERKASVLLPRVHPVFALLKRWLFGTHHRAVQNRHLQDYLDEFTFRFNRRKSRSRGRLSYRLTQQAALEPVTCREFVDSARTRQTLLTTTHG